ncbi:hypothetical protein BU24DRAFT_428670 [Aaosphaeria arxii CBS 175.79]|uniref:DUF3253 domain-containing protein n=1 Tax=Aaosphaeria arxii CBS 175.79 TaxID=1450172 RepID=A0A6A5X8L6_9PLEO|nr:uncharacterized protein BU24DRAFT_428670 [Aaosphaeria arxii CBS 175.79]KAF2009147.1 hypothetical protein BU24DRAFT_428670 [Aaosphaeria arxii CBS 175.79]
MEMVTLDEEQTKIVHNQLAVLLEKRQYPKTICPSEVARAFTQQELDALGARTWRDTMHNIRQLIWEMRNDGAVEVLQKGEILSDETMTLEDVHGPIRVRAKQIDEQR